MKTKNTYNWNKRQLEQEILQVFSQNSKLILNYRQVAKRLNVKGDALKQRVQEVMAELAHEEQLQEVSRGRFIYNAKEIFIVGTVDLTAKGSAYIVSDDLESDIFVSQRNLRHALNGDVVKVALYATRRGRQTEGEVVEIIERVKDTFVGTLEVSNGFAFVVTDSNSKMPYDIFIPQRELKKAESGQKVVVQIAEWPTKAKNPVGKIVDVLGWPGDNETEMHAIMVEFNLPYHFPDRVLKAAESISEVISDEDIASRRDFRSVTTFTIDPKDAKDFDDALSIRQLEDGLWEIGVHIADVSHYVESGSILDKEAIERATSVYLVDRVVPMLPERLSNFICSLRPNEDKLTFSAVFKINDKAEIKEEWFGRTIINSDRRFTYEEAQEIIEGNDDKLKNEILTLNTLAQIMRKKRFEKGSIGFDKVEVKFELDEKGKPLGVYFKESKEAHKLIEEFMLLANKKVAELIGKPTKDKKPKTFVYRVHDLPNQDKLFAFSNFVERFGHRLNIGNDKNISSSINALLEKVKNKPEQNVVETLAIRSMAKAEYTTENIGHYGLGFEFYTHFTSPIRRFPDVMVHRLLFAYLNGEASKPIAKYEEWCKISSQQEQMAANAERQSVKYKQVEFMQDKIGQRFAGVISGVTEWGIYVEIQAFKTEGMIRIKDLTDDHYFFDEENFCLIGRLYKRKFQLGDPLEIVVSRANLEKKQLDFVIAE
ncbi:MAG: ribonuclease R [Bacteroidales bacterium]|nr:ribonuclease R [Bacteroidales bacterium]